MNVLFLDIDGVLNSQPYNIENEKMLGRRLKREEEINPECINILRDIVKELDLKIVIASSWGTNELEGIFSKYDLTILDRIKGNGGYRGTYIKEWLSEHNNIDNFVILDDTFMRDYDGLENHVVQTDFYTTGLNNTHKDKIRKIILRETIN